MPRGLIQLTAQGGENIYLIGSQKLHFLNQYIKDRPNFSMESIEIVLPGVDTEIKNNSETDHL